MFPDLLVEYRVLFFFVSQHKSIWDGKQMASCAIRDSLDWRHAIFTHLFSKLAENHVKGRSNVVQINSFFAQTGTLANVEVDEAFLSGPSHFSNLRSWSLQLLLFLCDTLLIFVCMEVSVNLTMYALNYIRVNCSRFHGTLTILLILYTLLTTHPLLV